MTDTLQSIVVTPVGQLEPALAIAATRAGALGCLDLEFAVDNSAARRAVRRLEQHAGGPYGVKASYRQTELLAALDDGSLPRLTFVLLSADGEIDRDALQRHVEAARSRGLRVLLQVSDILLAQTGEGLGVDGVVAKGHESGGFVGEETTFVLLQRCLMHLSLPVFAHGGIGLHTAAACYAAGAAGIVLDAQLALAKESQLPEAVKDAVASMDGSETVCLGAELGQAVRLYRRPHTVATRQLAETASALDSEAQSDRQQAWLDAVESRIGWGDLEQQAWPLGQDAAFARALAERYHTVGGILQAYRDSVASHIEAAALSQPLDAGSALAQSHGTRYPIVQGPMTRVSDTARFAFDVAEAGGLPFLALALMRKEQAMPVLEETKHLLGDRPWGVGILGFVPAAIRSQQLEAIAAVGPDFAIIAGGRPDQAKTLEKQGIATYLHVPSPALLRLFLDDGAKRFIFEGRECGGHVGPRASFVLWNAMIDALLAHFDTTGADPAAYHILFAGGVHDSLSALMVASLAGPLAERGVRIGVLMGTAYLFTHEAVTSGAITARYQQEAVRSRQTVLVESGVGHMTRCLPTPFVEAFAQRKRTLVQEGADGDRLRQELEDLNIGRLRMASKGINRNPDARTQPGAPAYITLDEQEQYQQGMYMIGQVAGLRDEVCSLEELHREVSVAGARRLASLAATQQPASTEALLPPPARVAIIGIATVLPGAADLQTYWENILDKVDAISEIPVERFDWRRYYDPDKSARDKIYSRWGGFIDDVPLNPLDYGMPPNSIPSIEPMQLLMLEVVRAALKDAGYLDRPFARERTSVTMAVGGGLGDLGFNYGVRSYLPHYLSAASQEVIDRLDDALPEWTEDSFPGILLNVLAGRIANRFNLNGPNLVVDAACGSSLAALDIAVKDLQTHRTDVAIVGGADTVQSPFGFLAFSKTQALSPRGRCRPFDVEADGIAISEGLAVVVLKRLEDAERDGDRIYAVIQGVGASSDGRDRSLTAPRPLGQLLALRRAYGQAGFDPATLSLIEAHGTGTRLGDQVEAEALATLFQESGLDRPTCAVGSVKSMIGHTKSTAGLAGMIKVALGLYHKVLPPTLVDTPNPDISLNGSPIYVNSEPRPWLRPDDRAARRAGVSAFGFGGTNFHAALEEYRGDYLPRSASRHTWSEEIVVLRATDREGLLDEIDRLAGWLEAGNTPPLRHLAYTMARRARRVRQESALTLSLVASSLVDLRQMLAMARSELHAGADLILNPQGIYFADEPLGRAGKVAFLYPGQGSQYPNMLADLVMQFPHVGEPFERANSQLAGKLKRPLGEYVYPVPAYDDDTASRQRAELTDTRIAQPALGAAGLAVSRFLAAVGLQPDFVAGHSYGELVALCQAGVFDEDTLYAVSLARGQFMAEATGPDSGTMAAVIADRTVVEEVMRGLSDVTIANLNSPRQTVISGPTAAVERAVEVFIQRGIQARRIPVACAFHSPLVEPAQQRLAEYLEAVEFHPPQVGVYSNSLGGPYPDDPAQIRDVLSRQLAQPVRFTEEIEAMYAAGARIFVETGPRSVLTGLVHQILGNLPHLAVAVDSGGRGLSAVQRALAQVIAIGADIDLSVLYEGRDVQEISLNAPYADPARAAYGPTTWLVNGGRARRWLDVERGLPEPVVKPLDVALAASAVPDQPGVSAGQREQVAEPPRPAPDQPPIPAKQVAAQQQSAPLPQAAAYGDAAQVMVQTQELMARFLQMQANVMSSYLDDAPLAPAPILPGVPGGQTEVTPPATEPLQAEPAAVLKRQPRLPTSQPVAAPSPILRFTLAADRAPVINATAGLAPGRAVLIAADAYGVADQVAAALREQGYDAVIVRNRPAKHSNGANGANGSGSNGRAAHSDDWHYAATLTDGADVRAVLSAVRREHGAIGSLLYLAALSPAQPFAEMTLARWQQHVEADLVAFFNLLQDVQADLVGAAAAGGACLLAATQMGGDFAVGAESAGDFSPAQAGIAGLLKTAAHELPAVRAKVVDFGATDEASELARAILAETGAADGLTEVGYRDGVRTMITLRHAPVDSRLANTAILDDQCVVLVTGGARHHGQRCAGAG
ncbi:MAG: SDR family NAD(P)-dependent oxidoreductase [Caldilineales bacterium]